jgi:uncharacterized protein (TIGR02266 family)
MPVRGDGGQHSSKGGIGSPETAQGEGSERRQYPRVPVALNGSVRTENHFFASKTENLSVGGLFLATENLLPVGQHLELVIQLPDCPPIELTGEVRWVRGLQPGKKLTGPGMGVMFRDVPERARKAIENYLAWEEPAITYQED